MKTRLVLNAVILVVIAIVSGMLLLSNHPVASSTNERIEIPARGIIVTNTQNAGIVYWTSASVTVHNIGSVPVEITTINVQNVEHSSNPTAAPDIQNVEYSYSPTAAPGEFSAASNVIAPGQSVTFTITPSSATAVNPQTYFTVVTKNGVAAQALYSPYDFS